MLCSSFCSFKQCIAKSIHPLTFHKVTAQKRNCYRYIYQSRPSCNVSLGAHGKGLLQSGDSIVLVLPSLELSGNHHWVPLNAVYQRRSSSENMHHSLGYYEHQFSDPSASQQEEHLPSLENTTGKQLKDGFLIRERAAPAKKSDTECTTCTQQKAELQQRLCCLQCRALLDFNPSNSSSSNMSTTPSANPLPAFSQHRGHSSHRPFNGPGQLLTGKFKSNTTPIQPENLRDLSIGIQKSPFEKMLSNLTLVSQIDDTLKGFYRTHRPAERQKETKNASPQHCSSVKQNNASNSNERLSLNKFEIKDKTFMQELTPLTAPHTLLNSTICLESDAKRTGSASNMAAPRKPNRSNQDCYYTPKKLSISFKKPQRLFHLESVNKDKSSKHKLSARRSLQGKVEAMACKSGEPVDIDKQRQLLDHNEERIEGVFGIQDDHQVRCVSRSKKRRKHRLERTVLDQCQNCSATTENKKFRVFLKGTKKPLMNSKSNLEQDEELLQQSFDIYGE